MHVRTSFGDQLGGIAVLHEHAASRVRHQESVLLVLGSESAALRFYQAAAKSGLKLLETYQHNLSKEQVRALHLVTMHSKWNDVGTGLGYV